MWKHTIRMILAGLVAQWLQYSDAPEDGSYETYYIYGDDMGMSFPVLGNRRVAVTFQIVDMPSFTTPDGRVAQPIRESG